MKKKLLLFGTLFVLVFTIGLHVVKIESKTIDDISLPLDSNIRAFNGENITLLGGTKMVVSYGRVFTDPGYELNSVYGDVIVEGKVDTKRVGNYTLTYKIGEDTASRVVKVVDDIAPIVCLNGNNNIKLEQNIDIYVEYGAVATDNLSKNLSIEIEGKVDTTKVGNYEISYTAIDDAGNITTVIRNVSVVYTPIIITGAPFSGLVEGVNYTTIGTLSNSEDGRLVKWVFFFNNVNDSKDIQLYYLNNGSYSKINYIDAGFTFGEAGRPLKNGGNQAFKIVAILPSGVKSKDYNITIKIVDVKTGATIKTDNFTITVYKDLE